MAGLSSLAMFPTIEIKIDIFASLLWKLGLEGFVDQFASTSQIPLGFANKTSASLPD